MSKTTKVPVVMEHDYKFRAECTVDVDKFIELFGDHMSSVKREKITEIFRMKMLNFRRQSLEDIRLVMKEIEDGHVMLESVNHAEEYTGDRYYDDYK